ncbi:centrosomal protein of 290 kDa [Folsomia candida]|uniref:centrosomal protein of 290 kDa n=1 Tax=Folsomia candida TaxID=158441 RepID=UPI001604AD52|nr:centrosomal protein of 290 kDa [Folsomia candida]
MDKPKPAPRNRNTRNRRNRDRDRGKNSASYDDSQPTSPILSTPTPDSPSPIKRPDLHPHRKRDNNNDPEVDNISPIPSTSTTQKPQQQNADDPTTTPLEKNPPVKKGGGERSSTRTRRRRDSTDDDDDEDNDDDLIDASDLKRQIDRLERDLQRRDRELNEERIETEKCIESIKRLERDKIDLRREVEGLRDEAEDYRRALDEYKERAAKKFSSSGGGKRMAGGEYDNSDEGDEYYNDGNGKQQSQQSGFDMTVQQKNRQIQQLIEDTERLDDEKRSLEEKLTTLKESLSEATKQIESMTSDHFEQKGQLQKGDERIRQLEEEKTVLSIRERELLGYKERHDQYLENLCNAVDIRVDVWKKMMFDKDEEIDRLNAKISTLMSQIPNTQMDSERTTVQLLNHKLVEREHQIALLNEQLAQATEELESTSSFIASLQSKLNLTEDSKKTEYLVKSLQVTVKKLEDKLDRRTKQLSAVEKEAEDKSRTVTSLMGRMAAYEAGQYGLPEAVSEIKDLKIQIRIRDKQVEGVTQEINILYMQVNDLQEESEMLREKLGVEKEADISRETKRYTRTKKNELSALRSKVGNLEEEVVTLKTRNYSLKKQLAQVDMNPEQIVVPNSGGGSYLPDMDRERDGPDGGTGSVVSDRVSTDPVGTTRGDILVRNLTGFGVKSEEWKEKYEIILEENSALRRGLHEILDCMHKMTDDGNTEVMIQAPVLEELLREMSARGIINYPYPISSFHMKVCNLEGKCSQLREDLHRLRQEERQCREELFEAKNTISTLTEQLKSGVDTRPSQHFMSSSSPPPPPSNQERRVTFERGESLDRIDSEVHEISNKTRQESGNLHHDSFSTNLTFPKRRDFVVEALQEEIVSLRTQNESLARSVEQEKSQKMEQLEALVSKANELVTKNGDDPPAAQLKIEYLVAIQENQTNEINSLLRKLAQVGNEYMARLGHLERFQLKAIHQITTFHQVLENSVPIHLFHNAKKEIRHLSDKLVELEEKEATVVVKTVAFHKNTAEIAELRKERDALEEQLGKCQARLLETAAKFEDKTKPPPDSENNPEFSLQLSQSLKKYDDLKDKFDAVESSKKKIESEFHDLTEKYNTCVSTVNEKYIDTVAREEYDLLVNKLVNTEEILVTAKDECLKWKELAEMTQNQIKAIENIKYFEKVELDYLAKQVLELQSESSEKSLLAKAHHHMLTGDKEKHLAIQQVEKLLSKLSQLEAHSLQQSKIHQDREMSLISMHTHVIMRYRNLFAALHDSQTAQNYNYTTRSVTKMKTSNSDVKEAFELFEKTKRNCGELEEQLLEERLKGEELEEKCKLLEGMVNSLKEDGLGQEVVFESVQKAQEARVEATRWKRKAEQKSRDCLSLQESVHRLENITHELEDDRLKLEHALELKDSLTSTLIGKSVEDLHLRMVPSSHQGLHHQGPPLIETLSSTSMPLLAVSSTRLDTNATENKECQISSVPSHDHVSAAAHVEELLLEKNGLINSLQMMTIRVAELEGNVRAKEEALNEIKFIRAQQQERDGHHKRPTSADSDLQDALVVARESMTSLQERLKSKEENVNQYRRLLAEVRNEMQTSTERHVQEMRALQMTIHQQQQAFTRMKSTLSHPVKDSLNVEGTIKDQLTRIHELEDEVSQLQHAMSNTAAQLTAARSEAHRWRCHAEAKMKEADSVRDQQQVNLESLEELGSVRQELRETQRKLEESHQQLENVRSNSLKDSGMTDLVNVLRGELEEKDKQIEAYSKSLHNLKNSGTYTEKSSLEEKIQTKNSEVSFLKEQINELHKTVAAQQVKISKSAKPVVQRSADLDALRAKLQELTEAKAKVDKDFADLNRKRDEDEMKKIKSAERVARFEESKKWKATLKTGEIRISELESEIERFKSIVQNLRTSISRMEKDKIILETKLSSSRQNDNTRSSSASTRFSSDSQLSSQQAHILAQGEIARLKIEIHDLQELNEKTEFEGREEAERLKMEVKLLKERVVSQERQLTAYQIAQKGDAQVITEIENMSLREAHVQKEIRRLEEDNLYLNLQIEQLRLESPRLRDRVQHLQKMVEALKSEKPLVAHSDADKKSQKSLSELEKTINALKGVISKLQSENKKLQMRPPPTVSNVVSSEKLKTSVGSIVEEKKLLLDKVEYLEHENEKLTRKFLEANGRTESLEEKFNDVEKRAKSAEMRLKTFLDVTNKNNSPVSSETAEQGLVDVEQGHPSSLGSNVSALHQKLKAMQEELDTKNRLLAAAKHSLRAAEKATAPKPTTSPRPRDDSELPVAATTSAYLALV